ncbi:uncharacterized protein LOC128745871 [Sabethes cyaneus]|uniref:uncharacterized protein LOC128745871 n=1 Tax=Sabethes cyaneus TaxID=53552 RepID=UPI00237E7CA9|nr:uncharacterized protein LOC128745871 [Sabethes cyaneus]
MTRGILCRGCDVLTNHYLVLPVPNRNNYYKACIRQVNIQWKNQRKDELIKLDSTNLLPTYIMIESSISDRVKVIAYCSLSKIPSCARRCLLEVIVKNDNCYYLNIEYIFVGIKDIQVLFSRFNCRYYQVSFKNISSNLYNSNCYTLTHNKKLETIKKNIITKNPSNWIAREQEKLNEDVYFQRQNYFYYYYYNELEDDDDDDKNLQTPTRKIYNGPPPPTSSEPYIVTPIHHHPELKEQCVRLINFEWPRSRMARFLSLETSTDTLPTSLILSQMINGINTVLGHAKLTNVPADSNAVFLESVVVDFRYRGRGIGTYLVNEAERYCTKTLNIDNVYLATYGQEVFYAKLGYIFCNAINLFGTNTTRNTSSKKHWMKKVLSDWKIEYLDSRNNELTASPTFVTEKKLHSRAHMLTEHIGEHKLGVDTRLCVDVASLVDVWDARVYGQLGCKNRAGNYDISIQNMSSQLNTEIAIECPAEQ